MLELPQSFGFIETSWNLFCEQHGKSMVDSHFSVVSKYLETASYYSVIRSSEEVCSALMHEQQETNAARSLKGLHSQSLFTLGRVDFNVYPFKNFNLSL